MFKIIVAGTEEVLGTYESKSQADAALLTFAREPDTESVARHHPGAPKNDDVAEFHSGLRRTLYIEEKP